MMTTGAKQFALETGILFEASQDAASESKPLACSRHSLHTSGSVLPFFPGYAQKQTPPFANGRPRFYVPSPEASEAELAQASQWYVFLGAVLSPQLLSLAQKALIFVFDPCRERMEILLSQLPLPLLAKKNIFFFSGDIDALPEPLLYCIPPSVTEFGTPFFFAHDAVDEAYLRQVKVSLEILYYHHQLYPCESVKKSSRKVAGGYSFTHSRNLAENIGLLARPAHGPVEVLRGLCQGQTALLIAAGPDLAQHMGTVKELAGKCLVIVASKVCRTLLAHGVTPDIVVLMDSSDASAAEIEGLELPNSVLVSYTLARASVNPSFSHVFFFGQELEQVNLPSNAIDHLGSVINYAFFLAKFMDCRKVICAGIQLASVETQSEGYCPGCLPLASKTRSWPCPVAVPAYERPLYTTLNFLDVACHLRAMIHREGLEVVNMSKASLLYGHGITHCEQPEVLEAAVKIPLSDLLQKIAPSLADMHQHAAPSLQEVLNTMSLKWETLAAPEALLAHGGTEDLPERFAPLLEQLDGNGTSFLVQSHPDYDKNTFEGYFTASDKKMRYTAVMSYLSTLKKAAKAMQNTVLHST